MVDLFLFFICFICFCFPCPLFSSSSTGFFSNKKSAHIYHSIPYLYLLTEPLYTTVLTYRYAYALVTYRAYSYISCGDNDILLRIDPSIYVPSSQQLGVRSVGVGGRGTRVGMGGAVQSSYSRYTLYYY